MTLSLIPFEAEHLELVDMKEYERNTARNYNGLGYTLICDNYVVCCAGIISSVHGVGDVWMVVGKELSKHRKTIVKTIRGFFAMIGSFYHRLQMLVKTDDETALRFAEFLGFEREGILRKFDARNDYWMMAWLR